MGPAIELKDVVFAYPNGAMALNSINLKIEEHKKVALLGENGSGKTTLLLHLNGLHRPSGGEVTILGRLVDAENLDWVRTKVGMIFQNSDDQLFAPTVYQDIAFGPRNLGMGEAEVNERVEEILDVLNITHLRDRSPDALSGGQKRRVALAGVLVMDAEILCLDEPHSGLDPLGCLEFSDLLDELYAKGRTILVATHDVEFAASWADECIITCTRARWSGKGVQNTYFRTQNSLVDQASNCHHLFRYTTNCRRETLFLNEERRHLT